MESRTEWRLRGPPPSPGAQAGCRPRRPPRSPYTPGSAHHTVDPAPSELQGGRAPRDTTPPGSPHTQPPAPCQDAEHRAQSKRSASSWTPAPPQQRRYSAAGACLAGRSRAESGESRDRPIHHRGGTTRQPNRRGTHSMPGGEQETGRSPPLHPPNPREHEPIEQETGGEEGLDPSLGAPPDRPDC